MYEPSQEILDKYADVLVNFALNEGKGIKAEDIVRIDVPECAKPMLKALLRAVLKAGAYPMIKYIPTEIGKDYYKYATEKHLSFFPEKFYEGLAKQIDHRIRIISETNKQELKDVQPDKIMKRLKAQKKFRDMLTEKENKKEFSWTLALYGTEAMAKEANLSLEEYWKQIIKACFLEEKDPVQKWKEVTTEINSIREKLNTLPIKTLHVKSERTNLTVGIGKGRKWLSGSGANIPSFEIFISPDWRLTNGHIQFTEPLYRYGNMIKDAYLEFKDGVVTKASAKEGEDVLKQMIATKNANKIGEFSLTDKRFSRIDKFMGETLYDENVGKEFGNTHIALGMAYKSSYTGDPTKPSEKEWNDLGYNDSAVHTDIVSTENRVVTATLEDGTQKIIYKDGEFTL